MEKINETNKPKYTHEQFARAYEVLASSTLPSCECYDHHREALKYFKEHPEEAVDPNGLYDSVEVVLEKIRTVGL